MEQEKIFVNDVTDDGFVSKIHKQFTQLNIKKKNLKNGQKMRIDIFPKKTYRWPTGTQKDVQY